MSNVNSNEAKQLFARINNAFKYSCHVRTNILSPKNTLNHGFQGRYVQLCIYQENAMLLFTCGTYIKYPFNSIHDLDFVKNLFSQVKINYFARKFGRFKGDCESTCY